MSELNALRTPSTSCFKGFYDLYTRSFSTPGYVSNIGVTLMYSVKESSIPNTNAASIPNTNALRNTSVMSRKISHTLSDLNGVKHRYLVDFYIQVVNLFEEALKELRHLLEATPKLQRLGTIASLDADNEGVRFTSLMYDHCSDLVSLYLYSHLKVIHC
ncbi:hypothetical protein BJV82DRAFT_579012 [Fennellomyces sp. T-0311]|nr:hypothetical protein BJV82DRAFT_579012 [Fennellomyces sp. T-0311]